MKVPSVVPEIAHVVEGAVQYLLEAPVPTAPVASTMVTEVATPRRNPPLYASALAPPCRPLLSVHLRNGDGAMLTPDSGMVTAPVLIVPVLATGPDAVTSGRCQGTAVNITAWVVSPWVSYMVP